MSALQTLVFRNDDVRGCLDESLVQITELFLCRGLPITHAVEPANLSAKVSGWLLDMKRQHPNLIEIMQHGYDHRVKNRHQKGEFGGQRSYNEQFRDICAGKRLMDQYFGDQWFWCFNFPYGPYNPAAIRALDDLGYLVLNSHYNAALSRRLFYWIGHLLRRGYLLGHHVSWHLQRYPGTSLFEIDMCVSFIRRYLDEQTACEFLSLDELKREMGMYRHLPVVGVLLHHRYHDRPAKIALVERFLDWAVAEGFQFQSFETVYRAWKTREKLDR